MPKLTFLPFAWFDTSMEMPKELTSQMWWLSNLTVILITMGAIFIGIGFGLLIYGYFNYCSSTNQNCSHFQNESVKTETPEDAEEIHSDTTQLLDSSVQVEWWICTVGFNLFLMLHFKIFFILACDFTNFWSLVCNLWSFWH